jgi:4-methyl-5(b-hydroxyethyl)-thiazole monophosphate biosynthesis
MYTKTAIIALVSGFEEIEVVGIADVLRRAGIQTRIVSFVLDDALSGAHGIRICADTRYSPRDFVDVDAVILPGGMPGATNLNLLMSVHELVVEKHKEGKLIAAICAAPLVLGHLGLLKGRRATCYPGFEDQLTGAILTDEPVVTDGNIITGKGPGFVFDFALSIVSYLQTEAKAEEVARGLLLI